jgi:hypothetical protein
MLGLIQGVDGMGQKAESIRDIAVRKKSSCLSEMSSQPQPKNCGKQGKILQIIQQYPGGTKVTHVVTTLRLFGTDSDQNRMLEEIPRSGSDSLPL